MKKRLAPAALAVAAALLAGCGTTALPYAREMGPQGFRERGSRP